MGREPGVGVGSGAHVASMHLWQAACQDVITPAKWQGIQKHKRPGVMLQLCAGFREIPGNIRPRWGSHHGGF